MGGRPAIIYIASECHSGSTLLELLIGGHSRVVSLGETKWLAKRALATMRPDGLPEERSARGRCTCGRAGARDCPFWRRVESVLVERTQLRLADLDVASRDHQTFVRHNVALFEAVATVGGASVLVDSTKRVSRLRALLEAQAFTVHAVHLIRSPYGVAYSLVRRGESWVGAVNSYCRHLVAARRALRRCEYSVVRYEALVREPAATLEALMQRVGLAFEPGQLHAGPREHHSVGGNDMRFGWDGQIREDINWKENVSLGTRLCIGLLLPLAHSLAMARGSSRTVLRGSVAAAGGAQGFARSPPPPRASSASPTGSR
jgi:hypothetical protein